MWSLIKFSIMSFILILLLHYSFDFFKNKFSYNKEINIIDQQNKKYKDIIEEINTNNNFDFNSMQKDLINYAMEESNQ